MTTKHWSAGFTPEKMSRSGYVSEDGFALPDDAMDRAIIAGSLQRVAESQERIAELLETISKRLRYLEPGFAEKEAARKKAEAEENARFDAYWNAREKKIREVEDLCGKAVGKYVIMGGVHDLAPGDDAEKCAALDPIQILESVSVRSRKAREWLASHKEANP